MEALPLYSLPLYLNPSLPLVDHVDDPLDACPIKTLIEALDVIVRQISLFWHHFHINAASGLGAEHLMW